MHKWLLPFVPLLILALAAGMMACGDGEVGPASAPEGAGGPPEVLASTPTATTPEPVSLGCASFSTVPAGAGIWIDGANSGQLTPADVCGLIEGHHCYVLEKKGFAECRGTLHVRDGQTEVLPLIAMFELPVCAASAAVSAPDMKPRIVDFFPGTGETIYGFTIGGEYGASGSCEGAGIIYFPEECRVWREYDLIISGARFSDPQDVPKYESYRDPAYPWEVLEEDETTEFRGWRVAKSTRVLSGSGDWAGTYKVTIATSDVYRLTVSVKIPDIAYAEEKSQAILEVLIARFYAAW